MSKNNIATSSSFALICLIVVLFFSSGQLVAQDHDVEIDVEKGTLLVVCGDGSEIDRVVVDSSGTGDLASGFGADVVIDPDFLATLKSSLRPRVVVSNTKQRDSFVISFLAVAPFLLALIIFSKNRGRVISILAIVVVELILSMVALLFWLGENEKPITQSPKAVYCQPAANQGLIVFVSSKKQAFIRGARVEAVDEFCRQVDNTGKPVGRVIYRGKNEGYIIGSTDASKYLHDGDIITKLVTDRVENLDQIDFAGSSSIRRNAFSKQGLQDRMLIHGLCWTLVVMLLWVIAKRRDQKLSNVGKILILVAVGCNLVDVALIANSGKIEEERLRDETNINQQIEHAKTRMTRMLSKMAGEEFRYMRSEKWVGLADLIPMEGADESDEGLLNPYTGESMKCGMSPGNYNIEIIASPNDKNTSLYWLCIYDLDGRAMGMKIPGRTFANNEISFESVLEDDNDLQTPASMPVTTPLSRPESSPASLPAVLLDRK